MTSPGLRERKKQRTRWAIRDHALRLFAEQGYDATTVDQIAAAAEISPSTFFRYFRTKEDVVIEDEYDSALFGLLRDIPPDLPPLAALRRAIHLAFEREGPQGVAKLRERIELVRSHPALRARSAENMTQTMLVVARALAPRVGRDASDFEVRCFAGAVVGAMTQAIDIWFADDPAQPLVEALDHVFDFLESGLTL